MDGYIKLLRKFLEWEWYSDNNTKILFIHMLLRTNWKDGNFRGTTVSRGSFVSSLQKLAEETNLSVREIRTAINHLKTTGEVTSKAYPKFTVFTVNNYDLYQSDDMQIDKQETNNRQANDKQATTIEEGKKEKREEGNINTSNEVLAESEPDSAIPYRMIQDLYNSVCGSYPRLVKMSEKRKKAIRARMNTGYALEDFRKLFEKAEASDFLKGKNKRNWSADFDWLITDGNMAKTLEGKYDNDKGGKENDAGREAGGAKTLSDQVREWAESYTGEFEGF